jgi:8-oxo-dGTP pyrophosphatase MutT (NUDIX family)
VDKEEIRGRLAASCATGEAELYGVDTEPTGGTREPWRQPGVLSDAAAAPLVPAAAPLVPAAVLVALVGSPHGPEIVLTQRTAGLRNHPAQISLPGGRIEPGDSSPASAALREASEEIGLPPQRVDVLGCLPRHRTVTDYCVHPFVGWVDPPITLFPDEREVAEVFLVPLGFVMDPANRLRETAWRDGLKRSYYVLPFPGHRIWGATAAILVSLAQALR